MDKFLNKILCGDCLEVMPKIPADTMDSIVTDPPYELNFMGQKWDNTGISFNVEMWGEALRVLKPGGHLLAFGGTRTYHRMVCAIEDAGFEVRDQLQWLYGSGFPKSFNISKAIDKQAPRKGLFEKFAKHFAAQRKKKNLPQKTIAKKFLSKTGGITGCVWNWENGLNVPTKAQWKILQPMLELAHIFLPLIERIEAEREIVGRRKMKKVASSFGNTPKVDIGDGIVNITIPSTARAKQWDGWGTTLKPANEPICLGRKPLSEKTVEKNVLKWGTGGINIDGCKIDHSSSPVPSEVPRFPTNVILNEEAAKLLGANASSFFYCAKPSQAERNRLETKNNHTTVKPVKLMQYLCRLITPPKGTILDPFLGSGSTAIAALTENFNFVGIEQSKEYVKISKKRIKEIQPKLF